MYQFGNGLIKCLNCSSKYRGKKQREKIVYLCTNNAKNGNDACPRFVIEENDLKHVIESHLKLSGGRVEGSLSEHIHWIEVENKEIRIIYKDGTKSIINENPDHVGVKIKI